MKLPPIRWSSLRDRVVEHEGFELAFMRCFFALLVLWVVDWNISYQGQPRPNGLAHWFDFTFFSNPALQPWFFWSCAVALACYVVGFIPAVALTWVSFIVIGIGTLSQSQGAIGHSTQLLAMIVLAQCLIYWLRPLLVKRGPELRAPRETHNLAVHGTKVVIAAGYFVCGVVKLVRSDGLWIWQSPWLSVQFEKTRQMEYFNRLEVVQPDSWIDRLPDFIMNYPNLARLFLGSGLIVELVAILCLAGRRWSLAVGILIIVLHFTISVAMRLDFETHIAIVAIFLVNLPWWIRRTASAGAAAATGEAATAS